MSMTREEAVELLCYGDWLNVISEHIGKQDTERIAKAMCIVGKALRPITREQVEKMWRGEWVGVPRLGVYNMACSKCGYSPGIRFYSSDFCPNCGAPMTDEAVQMVMERMEALYEAE